jgi:hypothetical protein
MTPIYIYHHNNGEGCIKEHPTMKEPNKFDYTLAEYKKFSDKLYDYHLHTASLKTYPIVLSPELDGKEVKIKFQYHSNELVDISEADTWIDCNKDVYESVDPKNRRIIAVPIASPDKREGQEETEFTVYDPINNDFYEFDTLNEVQKMLKEDFTDPEEGIHPEIENLRIFKVVANVVVKQVPGKETFRIEVVPIAPVEEGKEDALIQINALVKISTAKEEKITYLMERLEAAEDYIKHLTGCFSMDEEIESMNKWQSLVNQQSK